MYGTRIEVTEHQFRTNHDLLLQRNRFVLQVVQLDRRGVNRVVAGSFHVEGTTTGLYRGNQGAGRRGDGQRLCFTISQFGRNLDFANQVTARVERHQHAVIAVIVSDDVDAD